MEGYLDAYNPNSSVTPAGIFINRVEVRVCVKLISHSFTILSIIEVENVAIKSIYSIQYHVKSIRSLIDCELAIIFLKIVLNS